MDLQESNHIFRIRRTKNAIKTCSQPLNPVMLNEVNPIPQDSEYSDPEFEYSESEDESQEEECKEEEKKLSNIELIVNQARNEEMAVPISCALFQEKQKEISPTNRESVVKWLIKLNYYFHLTNEVLFNSVEFLDILLCNKSVEKQNISAYAAVCYWVSAKVDTRAQPTIKEFNDASGCNFTHEIFSKIEVELITILNFKLHYPTTKFFMRQIQEELMAGEDRNVIDFARFLSEVSITKFGFLDFKPSMIASTIMIISFASFGHFSSAIDVASKEISFGSDVNVLSNCGKYLKREALAVINENKESKSKGIKELFDKANIDINFEEIIQLAICKLNE